ncbi:MAG: histidine kinase dimerization/phosphoacceptor domain -containing protein [Methanoregula sp.]|nr:histidine kinase dimerization/phosphoacceptor domain -containing protein [Methanoregula sp.]
MQTEQEPVNVKQTSKEPDISGDRLCHILVVEDEEPHRELIRRGFNECKGAFRISFAPTLADARRIIADDPPQLAFVDWLLPDGNGAELLPGYGGVSTFPIVMMTCHGDEELAVSLMKAGALDYLVKSDVVFAAIAHAAEQALRESDHITERKRAEEALKKSHDELEQRVKERTAQLTVLLNEREILVKEVHHRVKNNFQIIISLLNLQSRYITDEKNLNSFKESQNRIRAMALVHEKLYRSADLSKLDLDNYIRFLANNLFQFYGMAGKGITITMDIRDIFLTIDTAIPLGLIINELVSNSLKHAFPDGRNGEISLAIRRENALLAIEYKDNGIGIPGDLDWRNAESLGLRLVCTLVEQLDGTIELDRSAGTAFTIIVKEKE